MASGTVTIKVRPLRVGFLVDPSDRPGLYRAIELSTFLWGGSHNPIIPTYRRTPARWEPDRVRHRPVTSDIINGYLSGFDPDLVVPVGICADRYFQVGNRDIVKADELIGELKDSASPRYGIGLIELLNDFIQKELKYKRTDDLQVSFPEIPRSYGLFLASVFGVLPETARQIIDREFSNILDIMKLDVKLNSLPEFIKSNILFTRRFNSWALKKSPLRIARLFVCDATSTLDIIDYWNLRAAGFRVVPIPIQAAEADNIKSLARHIIEMNYRPNRHNPRMYHYTRVQRSRSLDEDAVRKFCESLNIPKPENKAMPKYLLEWSYPRLWDTGFRENVSGERISFPYAYVEERQIAERSDRLELRSFDPKIQPFFRLSDKPQFANEFRFRFYGSKEPMAAIFPEGSRELSSAIGRIGYFHWRFSKFGPVFMATNYRDLIFLELPLAEAVMKEWFKERGWKVSLSGPGRIAKQLLRQLGGEIGISRLAHKGVIELLADLEKEAGMPRQAVMAKLKRVVQLGGLFIDAERFLENLISTNALRLGAKIQCPVCTRYNWYELNALDYELQCRFCLSTFSPPLESPKDIKWTYRAHGPFASSVAKGSFTVLLTFKLLGGNIDQEVTPLFSYVAEKDGKRLEADLTCLKRHETGTDVIHAECKSFNRFERKDIARMKELSAAFPGSALIFATLNNELQESEVKLIQRLAVTERKKEIRGKPSSPVILLTGTELFSHRLTDVWRKRGGAYAQFSERSYELSKLPILAEATQQLYLNLPPWEEWFDAELKEWRQKQASKKPKI